MYTDVSYKPDASSFRVKEKNNTWENSTFLSPEVSIRLPMDEDVFFRWLFEFPPDHTVSYFGKNKDFWLRLIIRDGITMPTVFPLV
jgi:hypothetical protein